MAACAAGIGARTLPAASRRSAGRLKGLRDVVAGVIVLTVMATSGHRELGFVLLVVAGVALGDMTVVLAGKGRAATALRVHGATAAVMIVAAVPLIVGAA